MKRRIVRVAWAGVASLVLTVSTTLLQYGPFKSVATHFFAPGAYAVCFLVPRAMISESHDLYVWLGVCLNQIFVWALLDVLLNLRYEFLNRRSEQK